MTQPAANDDSSGSTSAVAEPPATAPVHSKKAALMAEAKEAACRASLQCWADNNANDVTAATLCKVWLNNHSDRQIKWTDGLFTLMFNKIEWADQKSGSVIYLGDQLLMQNPYGAMVYNTYACTFDPSTQSVTAIQLGVGRDTDQDTVLSTLTSPNLLSAPVSMPK